MNGFKKVVLFLKVIVCLLAQRRFGNIIHGIVLYCVYWIRSHWIQFFFSILVTIYFSILKHFSLVWNIFLDSEFFFLELETFSTILKNFFLEFIFFFWLWNIFLDSKVLFSIVNFFSWWWLWAIILFKYCVWTFIQTNLLSC